MSVVSPTDPASVHLSAAALAADTAKRAQLQQMQVYIAGVQPLFESVLTDLLLQQPADPHQFLLDALGQVPAATRADLSRQLQQQDQRKFNQEDANFNRAKNALVVVLTLTLSDDPACKERVVATLRELQRAALAMPACIRYDICHSPSSAELLINQQWATQSGLDEFYASAEFARATPQFAGQLAGPPEERVYHPV